jgi:hypothetical protein
MRSIALVLVQSLAMWAIVLPAFSDLTIRRRHVYSESTSFRSSDTLYLKGARERYEARLEGSSPNASSSASITQCDQRRTVTLNVDLQLYAVSVMNDRSTPWRQPSLAEATGPEVLTTFDAFDTGERRSMGHYVARRVITTRIVEPSPGAATPAETREIDGWYIDLPGLGCFDGESAFLTTLSVVASGIRDRQRYVTKRAARHGYALEETTRTTYAGRVHVDRIELIELSERPLDPALFEIPHDYRAALPLPRGGYDLAKADTVVNRLRAYWNDISSAAQTFFR